uniref:TraB domain containing n=2 Tax=Latimeria chalumnae TaxID=7897 RepID=H3BG56_LATCH
MSLDCQSTWGLACSRLYAQVVGVDGEAAAEEEANSEPDIDIVDANEPGVGVKYSPEDLANWERRWALRRAEGFVPPDSVTVLETAQGSRVYIVGVAHFSQRSQEDVQKVVRTLQPDVVMVELCSGRQEVMMMSEEEAFKEAGSVFSASRFSSAIKRNGLGLSLIHLSLKLSQAHVMRKLNMAPGGEMRAAFTEACKVPGCKVVLGDRAIDITLRRGLAALDFTSLGGFLRRKAAREKKRPLSLEVVEEMKQREKVEEVLAESRKRSPGLTKALVTERDEFLVHAARLAATPISLADGTDYPSLVVAVVGAGHVPGMVANWTKKIDVKEITNIPPPGPVAEAMKKGASAVMTATVAYITYRVYKRLKH